jgi:glyceraldehyde-3-phosphate dehydrogenase/erythrose-4-phosphate dehydrogenase
VRAFHTLKDIKKSVKEWQSKRDFKHRKIGFKKKGERGLKRSKPKKSGCGRRIVVFCQPKVKKKKRGEKFLKKHNIQELFVSNP